MGLQFLPGENVTASTRKQSGVLGSLRHGDRLVGARVFEVVATRYRWRLCTDEGTYRVAGLLVDPGENGYAIGASEKESTAAGSR